MIDYSSCIQQLKPVPNWDLYGNSGLLKRKKPSYMEHAVKAARTKTSKPQLRSVTGLTVSVIRFIGVEK